MECIFKEFFVRINAFFFVIRPPFKYRLGFNVSSFWYGLIQVNVVANSSEYLMKSFISYRSAHPQNYNPSNNNIKMM